MFEHILGFLGNQSLTKLQSVTGDRYRQCESQLSKCCCACENDRPVITNGLCGVCESALDTFKPCVTKTEARELYGIRNFSDIPCNERRHYILYARADLDKHMLDTCESEREWVRSIAQRRARVAKRAAVKQQKQDDLNAFLKTLPAAFVSYIASIEFKSTDESILDECSLRFTTLVTALDGRGLVLRDDSRLCEQFITTGVGDIQNVVDTMEEMGFLFAHTEYQKKGRANIKAFRNEVEMYGDWYSRDEYRTNLQLCREDAKLELCVEYLADGKGFALPRKWENCRARFDSMKSAGKDPSGESAWDYIYTGEGGPPDN